MRERLRGIFRRSLTQFLGNETENILSGTAERNLCARWAPLLETEANAEGFKQYVADADYNRMQNGRVKVILGDDMKEIPIVCDLILHSRGQCPSCDNLIAIEMKRNTRRKKQKDSDKQRLRILTRTSFDGIWSADGIALPEYVCGYKLGYYIEFNIKARTYLIEEYEEGEGSGIVARRF